MEATLRRTRAFAELPSVAIELSTFQGMDIVPRNAKTLYVRRHLLSYTLLFLVVPKVVRILHGSISGGQRINALHYIALRIKIYLFMWWICAIFAYSSLR